MPGGGMMPFQNALEALAAGACRTMAIVHSLPSRAIGRNYGGQTYSGSGRDSYYYYHPWGWSSQAAHWALMFTYYAATYGATEADLGEVAVTVRSHAGRNENAIMRTPMTIDDYLASRYIVRPMRLFDLCLVNDGAVCVILTDRDRAGDRPASPRSRGRVGECLRAVLEDARDGEGTPSPAIGLRRRPGTWDGRAHGHRRRPLRGL